MNSTTKSKTVKARSCNVEAIDGRTWTLSLTEHGKHVAHRDTYLITLAHDRPGFASYQVDKTDSTRPGSEGESYFVTVAHQVADCCCTCKGHRYHHHCKHVDAFRALIEAGRLPEIADESELDNDMETLEVLEAVWHQGYDWE